MLLLVTREITLTKLFYTPAAGSRVGRRFIKEYDDDADARSPEK